MPKRCMVCGNYQQRGLVTLHRLPNDERKSLWLKALGKTPKDLRRWNYVCCNHFQKGDFIIRPSGMKVLKQSAIPIRPAGARSPKISSSEKETVWILNEDDDDSSRTLTASPESNFEDEDNTAHSEEVNDQEIQENENSSSTISASECVSYQFILSPPTASQNISRSPSPPTETKSEKISRKRARSSESNLPEDKKKWKRKCYVGDFSNKDFQSPQKAEQAFVVAKKKISEQKKKIDTIRKQNVRIKTKIASLQTLVKFLKHDNSGSVRDSTEGTNGVTGTEVVNVNTLCCDNTDMLGQPSASSSSKTASFNLGPNKKQSKRCTQYDDICEMSEDEFDLFGKYVANHLRNLDVIKAIDIQSQIYTILSKNKADVDKKRTESNEDFLMSDAESVFQWSSSSESIEEDVDSDALNEDISDSAD